MDKKDTLRMGFASALTTSNRPNFITNTLSTNSTYVNYGDDNAYPNYLWHLYLNNTYHQSIIDGIVEYIVGQGVESDIKFINKYGDTLEDVVNKIVFDFYLFGGFALKVNKSRVNEVLNVEHVDFMQVRVDKQLTTAYICEDWTNQYNNKAKSMPIVNQGNKLTSNTTGLFYYKGERTRTVYPIPVYVGSLTSLECQIGIQDYHINNIHNNFNVSAIVNMNNGVPSSTEEIKAIEKAINDKFCGANNASKFMIMFNESAEQATTIERMEGDNLDTKFEQLSKDTRNTIFSAHRITSPALFGVLMENTGFSKTEFNEAFEIFNKTVIMRAQKVIAKQLDKVFGKENVITFIPFNIDADNEEVKATETTVDDKKNPTEDKETPKKDVNNE